MVQPAPLPPLPPPPPPGAPYLPQQLYRSAIPITRSRALPPFPTNNNTAVSTRQSRTVNHHINNLPKIIQIERIQN